jgi:hypothetical protein
MDMSDEPGELEDLVRRLIREQLAQGGLEKLLRVKQAMEESGTVIRPEGAVLKLVGGTVNVNVEPEVRVEGSLGAAMATPGMQAEGTVSPDS